MRWRVRLAPPPTTTLHVDVHAWVEDVGRSDAAAVPVAHAVARDLRVGPDQPTVEVEIEVPSGAAASWALRVLVDGDGDGEMGVGDYITMEHVGVAESDGHEVCVRRIGG